MTTGLAKCDACGTGRRIGEAKCVKVVENDGQVEVLIIDHTTDYSGITINVDDAGLLAIALIDIVKADRRRNGPQ